MDGLYFTYVTNKFVYNFDRDAIRIWMDQLICYFNFEVWIKNFKRIAKFSSDLLLII